MTDARVMGLGALTDVVAPDRVVGIPVEPFVARAFALVGALAVVIAIAAAPSGPFSVTSGALLGVKGDGVAKPFILGSHSFGAAPILGNECSNPFSVGLDLVDLRGTGGTYSIRAYPNRNTDASAVTFTAF